MEDVTREVICTLILRKLDEIEMWHQKGGIEDEDYNRIKKTCEELLDVFD